MDVGWRWRERVAASGSGTSSRESRSARSFALPGALGPGVNPRTVQALAFGQGDLLAAAEVGGAVRIWDVGRRELLRPPLRLPPSVYGLAFSPDGSQLAIPFGAFSDEGPNGVEILDVGSGERVARLSPDGEVQSVAFSPDGGLLAGGKVDGGALLWATDGWRRVGRPLARRNASAVTRSRLHSPSGVLTGRAHTCDLALGPLGGALGRRLAGADRAPPARPRGARGRHRVTARFTPDGAHLFVLSDPDSGGGQGFEPLARDPLGGRSRPLAATRVRARRRRPHSRAVGGARPRAGLPVGLPLGLTSASVAHA